MAGLVATQRASSEIIKPAKSDNKCAASVMIARLLAKYPPEVKKKDVSKNDVYLFCIRLHRDECRFKQTLIKGAKLTKC